MNRIISRILSTLERVVNALLDTHQKLKELYKSWGTPLDVDEFISTISEKLESSGFRADNSRLAFSVCPDDLNRLDSRKTIERALVKQYDGEFHLGSLGAYPIAGKTGIVAASHHAPAIIEQDGSAEGNLIIFASAHVGFQPDDGGLFGKVKRPGQEKITTCCGAMMGFLRRLKESKSTSIFNSNIENRIDIAREVFFSELASNFTPELTRLLSIKEENRQVIELSKINYALISLKLKEIVTSFVNENDFEGQIALIGGITVNLTEEDHFIWKEFEVLKGKK